GRPLLATVSIGIAVSHDATLDLAALLAQADHALYRAKDNGRNRIEVASIELMLDRIRRAGLGRENGSGKIRRLGRPPPISPRRASRSPDPLRRSAAPRLPPWRRRNARAGRSG